VGLHTSRIVLQVSCSFFSLLGVSVELPDSFATIRDPLDVV